MKNIDEIDKYHPKIVLFNIEEWYRKMNIHERIQKKLAPYGIKFVYGYYDPNLDYRFFGEFYAFKKLSESFKKENTQFLLYLVIKIGKKQFPWLIRALDQECPESCKKLLLLNCSKNRLFTQLPKDVTIIHKYRDDILTPSPRKYNKKNMYDKLKNKINSVSTFPIHPKAIYGYGSFFRNKNKLGDVDLYIDYDYDHPKWKKFKSFFRFGSLYDGIGNDEEKQNNFYKLRKMLKEYYFSIEGKKPQFQKICLEEEFRVKLNKFNIDIELLQYCTWSELLGSKDWMFGHFVPDLSAIFKKMFRKRTKGIEIQPFNRLNDGKNYILLWSPEKPNFEENYSEWEKIKNEYIKNEYLHLVSDLDNWIKKFVENRKYYFKEVELEINRLDDEACERFKRLKAKFPPKIEEDATFESISEKVNNLREEMKKITTEVAEKKEQIKIKKDLQFYKNLGKNKNHIF